MQKIVVDISDPLNFKYDPKGSHTVTGVEVKAGVNMDFLNEKFSGQQLDKLMFLDIYKSEFNSPMLWDEDPKQEIYSLGRGQEIIIYSDDILFTSGEGVFIVNKDRENFVFSPDRGKDSNQFLTLFPGFSFSNGYTTLEVCLFYDLFRSDLKDQVEAIKFKQEVINQRSKLPVPGDCNDLPF